MNKSYKVKIILLFLAAAATLLSGCSGASGTAANDHSENTGNTDETLRTGDDETASSMQSGQNTELKPQIVPESAQHGSESPRPDATDPALADFCLQYSWQEITVTFPADWKDRCVIEENANGFSVFQKASYEKDNDGFICSFYRTSDYINYGVGETLLAYTDSGQLYYLMIATDFACTSDNAEIISEYSSMCAQVDDLTLSVQATDPEGIHYDAGEYILPVSNILSLNQENIANLSDNELWIAKNEIFARHGRMFKNTYLQLYFNHCTWYQGTVPPEQFDENVLTRTEQDNLQLLIAAEQEYDRLHPYPRQYKITDSVVEDLSGSGISNEIAYHVSQNGYCEITIDGDSYDLDNVSDHHICSPEPDIFFITDIVESDNFLEIAILDNGPSFDLVTHFFRYDGTLSYIGMVGGWPFAELNSGINGFNGFGGIIGQTRTDLIETSYPDGYWWYDPNRKQLVYQDTKWHSYPFPQAHLLYEDLPLRLKPDASSENVVIPADTEIYFLATDMEEWILVKGKNGIQGYMQVADTKIVDMDKLAAEVISDLHFFD